MIKFLGIPPGLGHKYKDHKVRFWNYLPKFLSDLAESPDPVQRYTKTFSTTDNIFTINYFELTHFINVWFNV